MELYLAKTDPIETIVEHTDKLMTQFFLLKNMLSNVENPYLDWPLLQLACMYHDLGKMNPKFQNKLREKLDYPLIKEDGLAPLVELYHNHLGPAFIPQEIITSLSLTDQIILFQAIYRHHIRPENTDALKAYIKEINVDVSCFGFENSPYLKHLKIADKLNTKYRKYIDGFITDEKYYPYFLPYNYENMDIKKIKNCILPLFYKYIMTKGLLNKIDYAASTVLDGNSISIEVQPEDVTQKTITYLEHITQKSNATNALQNYLLQNADENNIVVAATGFGKTEAGLLWLNNQKGFFTLPLKVSINAIFDRLIDKIGLEKEKVGLLHSDTFSELIKRDHSKKPDDITTFDDRYLSQTKQLSMPLTVCTLDQLIDFVFLYDGFEVKLATLAYSKIIIDEIQMYSPDYLACLIIALKYISALGGKFTILTATLPPIIIDQLANFEIPFILAPEKYYKPELRHVVDVFEEPLNLTHLKEHFDPTKKYLIICNTVKKAQLIFDTLLSDDFDCIHSRCNVNLLHSRFIKQDRNQKEDAIQELGNRDCFESGIWVTTQIVEASLDIDFDYLYTELSEVNGLFQRMGRCFRNRVNTKCVTNVFVYVGDDNTLPSLVSKQRATHSIDYGIFSHSKQILLENKKKGVFKYTEKLKMDMVDEVYCSENLSKSQNIKESYYSKLNELLNYLYTLEPYAPINKELALRDIQQITFIPLQVYREHQDTIDDLISRLRQCDKEEKRETNQAKRKALKKSNKIVKQRLVDKINNYQTSCPQNKYREFHFMKLEVNDYLFFYVGNFVYDNIYGLKYEKFEGNHIDKNGVDFF